MTSSFVEYSLTTDFKIGKAISFELMRALYENPIAIAEGAVGAPRMEPRAIAPGGSRVDGACGNATTIGLGLYDFEGMNLSAAKVAGYASIIRVKGDTTISAALSAAMYVGDGRTDAAALLGGVLAPSQSSSFAGAGGWGAGGSSGGNPGSAGVGTRFSLINRRWLSRAFILGGSVFDGSTLRTAGAGAIILIVDGDLDMTGGTISANGNGGGSTYGGAGGGTVIVICTGTITNGTFSARGGDAGSASGRGAGGGGYVCVVASGYAGVQTITAAAGFSGHSVAVNGFTEKLTLTEPEINGLLLRGLI